MVTVVDSHCGSGKTTWAIQYINEMKPRQKILFITPFLSECDRIARECPDKKFISPDVRHGKGRKIDSLAYLIQSGKNIVATHSLFSNLDNNLLEDIRNQNYILFIDEALEILKKVNIYSEQGTDEEGERKTFNDIQTMREREIISVGEDGEISWNEQATLNKYNYIKERSKLNSLISLSNTVLMWTFPYKIFKDDFFKDIYILTYMFDYQLQSYYFQYYNIDYSKKELILQNDKYDIVDYGHSMSDILFRSKIKNLIEIYDGEKLNSVGTYSFSSTEHTPETALCIGWYDKNKDGVKRVKRNVINYFSNISKYSGKEQMWTCFKKHMNNIGGGVVSKKNFIAINARATNDFANKKSLCYLINRYLNPCFVQFFAQRDIHIDQDKFALSELVQWIWRSAIRNNEKIQIYIPSKRMRTLLIDWLNV